MLLLQLGSSNSVLTLYGSILAPVLKLFKLLFWVLGVITADLSQKLLVNGSLSSDFLPRSKQGA